MHRPLHSIGALAATIVVACIAAPAASAAPAQRAFALSGSGADLLAFDPAAPAATTSRAILGIAPGETLVGIDVRPANGMLYALGVNAATDTATLYVLGRDTGQLGVVGAAP